MGGNRHLSAQAKDNSGQELRIQTHDTDSPILPIEQLERLHQFRPELVDWVIEQTTKEAENRRIQDARVNGFIFIERILGILASFAVCLVGTIGGGYVALHGEPTAGGIIATVSIGTLAVAYLNRKNNTPKSS